MSDASPARKGLFIPVVAALGVFAVFLVLLQIARSPATPVANAANVPAEDLWKFSAEGRKARLTEIRTAAQATATGYAWIDKDAGVVLLPVDRAMQLTIDELNAKK
jgi:hypothetical protein